LRLERTEQQLRLLQKISRCMVRPMALQPALDEVVALVADGLSNREVARELHLSEHTVKKYLFRIFEKLGISSRVELVLYALSHGGARQAEWVPGAAG
jgi:DNA-binding NarL/FixJ family response regulator